MAGRATRSAGAGARKTQGGAKAGYRSWFRSIHDHSETYEIDEVVYRARDGALLEVAHDFDALRATPAEEWKRIFRERAHTSGWPYGSGVWGKKEWVLPCVDDENVVSMYEGNTNLFWANRYGMELGLEDLWIKQCGNSHTGSFKDLGMTVLVSMVKEMITSRGKSIPAVACASTGDTSAALAAYAAATLGLCAVVAPWTLRNAIEFGRFIPVSQNYKGAILGANCAEIYGSPKYRGTWSPRCIHAFDFGGMTEAEIFDRGRDTGLRYAFDHRDQLPAVVAARLLRTWGLYDPAEWQGYAETEVRSSRFQQRTFWIGWGLLALAPVGLVVVRRRSTASFWILAAPIALVCASSVIGYGNTRFRAAAEPALVVLAAVALARFGAARCARPPDSTAG